MHFQLTPAVGFFTASSKGGSSRMVAVSGVMEVALAKPLANVEAWLNTRDRSEVKKPN